MSTDGDDRLSLDELRTLDEATGDESLSEEQLQASTGFSCVQLFVVWDDN